MSYQVLARKWRPRVFRDVAGQVHVLRALTNALAQGRLHHAYLFSGTRGVGKTTVARILAKCLNCEADGVTAEPCGECSACREIDQGRFVDLVEVDAASRTRVDDTRELLDNVQYAPTRGRFKVYLIDEVHMLSGHSFNALLKTLEEPPPHVKFLLATTDPQRLPVTVLSRCLQFNLRPLARELIGRRLAWILEQEDLPYESGALERLARAADGSMRDALSLLDQAIAFGDGRVEEAATQAMLGTLDQAFVEELLEAVAAEDAPALMAVVERMAVHGADFTDALGELLAALHRMARLQLLGAEEDEGAALWQALAGRVSPEDVQLWYQIGINGRRDLPLAPDPRTGFEMTLLRMVAFRPASAAAPPPAPQRRPAQGSADSAAPQEPAEAAPAGPAASGADAAGSWPELVATLPNGMARMLAQHCELVERTAERLRLRLPPAHGHLLSGNVQERLRAALAELAGRPGLKLAVELGETRSETPAESQARESAGRRRAAVEAIETDPNVSALCEAFDATVVPDSIEPLDDD